MSDPPRTVHYVGFRDDRYWNARRVFGGPRMIHRRWDRYAVAEVGPDDLVIFAEGDETQPVVRGGRGRGREVVAAVTSLAPVQATRHRGGPAKGMRDDGQRRR